MTKRGGRKSILTDALIDELASNLSAGMSIKDACALSGISLGVFMKWQERGNAEQERRNEGLKPNEKEEIYIQFLERATRARVEGRRAAVGVIMEAMRNARANDELAFRAATWFLERSVPEEWGRQVRTVEHTGNVSVSWDGIVGRLSDALAEAGDDDTDTVG